MHKSRSFVAFGILPSGLLAASMLLCGCEKSEKISKYTVPKHESLQTTKFLADYDRRHPKPERMIGVVVPRETVLWFFKLQATPEVLAPRVDDVREFLKTLRFPANENPVWVLPPGWRQLKASEMRYATLVLDGEPPLEMSVTQLPTRPDMPIVEQVVSNINRWRGQLSLPPIEVEDLEAQAETMQLDNAPAFWIDIVGRPKPKPTGMTPMPPQKKLPDGKGHDENGKAAAPAYEKPEGWIEAATKFAAVSLQAVDGEATVAITVTRAGGDRLANVNRWRNQLQLEPWTAEQLAAAGKKVEVGKISADEYDMTNETKAIFGVIVEDRGQSWFIKLAGNLALAERERPRFEAFLKSLQLN